MSCTTCGHTMEQVHRDAVTKLFWCPRCGTLRSLFDFCGPENAVPKLVERCREFERLPATLPTVIDWKRLGITESIRRPEDRPT